MRNLILSSVAAIATMAAGAVSSAAIVTFQQGANGYSGTADTFLVAGANADNPRGTNVGVQTRGDSHGLIRFDDIFGSGPNQIPAGQQIISATLTVTTNNQSVDGFQFHRMLLPFDEATDTWNTWKSGTSGRNLTEGVQADGQEASTVVEYIVAPGSVDTVATHTFDLTASVQAWYAGQANHGWVILPASTAQTDSWIFRSRDWTTQSERPLLTVEYAVPEPACLAIVGLGTLRLLRRRASTGPRR